MSLFTPSLWPGATATPWRKLVMSILFAPLLPLLLLAVLVFLIGGMTQTNRELALAYTYETVPVLVIAIYVFTLTFGLAGIAVLWALGQRGLLVWALTGGVLGVAAGLFLGLTMAEGPPAELLIACAVLGWILFVLIRRFAGVRAPERPRPSTSLD